MCKVLRRELHKLQNYKIKYVYYIRHSFFLEKYKLRETYKKLFGYSNYCIFLVKRLKGMIMIIPFKIGELYSRNDVYTILSVPEERQGGIWNTGYREYEDDFYVFSTIEGPGSTGHNYDNKFIGDDLLWYTKNSHSLKTKTIQEMLNREKNIYVFTRENNKDKFTYQGNARAKETKDGKPAMILWEFKDHREYHPQKAIEEVADGENYKEGSVKKITVNAYERNPVARKKCIDHYGCQCSICNFDFEQTYGEIGKEFIHVHHLVELSTIKGEYEVDPIEDLRPVCPNCHAMLHRRKPAYSIQEIKE